MCEVAIFVYLQNTNLALWHGQSTQSFLKTLQNNGKFTHNAFSDGISLQGICKIGKLSDKAFSDSLSSVEGGATCTVCDHSQEAE